MKEFYNLEKVYDEEISPLMKQIIQICKNNNIPMVASFVFENDEDKGEGHCTTSINNIETRISNSITEAVKIIYARNPQSLAIAITKANE